MYADAGFEFVSDLAVDCEFVFVIFTLDWFERRARERLLGLGDERFDDRKAGVELAVFWQQRA